MEKIKKGHIVSAINIGSSRVSACIAKVEPDFRIAVIGLGKADIKHAPSEKSVDAEWGSAAGFMGAKGVLGIDILANAMKCAMRSAEEEAGIKITRAFVGVSGANVTGERSKGMIRIGKRGEEISNSHIKDALRIAEAIPLGVEKEIIHSISQNFTVDGQSGIRNPLGLYGVKLEVDAFLIALDVPFLQNVIKCLNIAGVELEDMVFSGIASSACVFSGEENPGCALLAEVDTNFTSISVFSDNILRGISIYGANILLEGAMELLRDSAVKICGPNSISRIVITGNSFLSEEIVEKMEALFGIPAEIGYSHNIKGSAHDINNPAYITVMGLAIYGAKKRLGVVPLTRTAGSIFNRVTNRLKILFTEYF